MKRLVTVIGLITLIMFLFTGCSGGVSQEEYDAAVKEANELKALLSGVQAELTKNKADLATTQQSLTQVIDDRDSIIKQLDKSKTDLTAVQTNLSKSNADLATTQQSLLTLNTSAKIYQVYVDVAIAYFEMQKQYHMGVAWDTIVQVYIPKIKDAVHATKDSELINAWDNDPTEISFYQLIVKRLTELKPKIQ